MKKLFTTLFMIFTLNAVAQDNITLNVDKNIIVPSNYNLIIQPPDSKNSDEFLPAQKGFHETEIFKRLSTIAFILSLVFGVPCYFISIMGPGKPFALPKKGELNWYLFILTSVFFGITMSLLAVYMVATFIAYVSDTFKLVVG